MVVEQVGMRKIVTKFANRKSLQSSAQLAAALFALLQFEAHAQENKLITPYADVAFVQTSNLFNTADDVSLPDGQQRGDTALRSMVGIALQKELGRQNLSARASITNSKQSHYKQLNYDARDMQGNFNWRLGSHLSGNVTASRSTSLTPYIEFRDSLRNLRVQENRSLDAAWRFHPSWRIRGSLVEYDLVYELQTQKFGDRKQRSADIWIDYMASSGSTIGVMVRHSKQKFPFAEIVGSQNIINNHQTDEVKMKIDWQFTAKTKLQILAGMVSRRHEFLQVRDYSGFNGRISGNWYPTGKSEFGFAVWHEIESTNNLTTNYALNDGFRLTPIWHISTRMQLDANLKHENRKPVGIPGVTLRYRESMTEFALNFTYAPLPRLQLVAGLGRENLRSTLAQRTYTSNSMRLNVHYEY